MRLLSILIASSGFLFFSCEVSRLLFSLKNTTQNLVNTWNASTVLLNARSYKQAGYPLPVIKEKLAPLWGDMSHAELDQLGENISCQEVFFRLSWVNSTSSQAQVMEVPVCP